MNQGLEAARRTTIEMLNNYHSRGSDECLLKIIQGLLKKSGVYPWAICVVVSTYGVRFGAFLLEMAPNPVALMACCSVPMNLAEENPYDGLHFVLLRTDRSVTSLPDLFIRTGLPCHSLDIRCSRLKKREEKKWLVVTTVYVQDTKETRHQNLGRFEFDREVIAEDKLLAFVDRHLDDKYILSDDFTYEKLVSALSR